MHIIASCKVEEMLYVFSWLLDAELVLSGNVLRGHQNLSLPHVLLSH